MDVKTVSIILGHASVSFTMDTYTYVLIDHKQESMALMEELFNATQTASPDQVYPVIVTPRPGRHSRPIHAGLPANHLCVHGPGAKPDRHPGAAPRSAADLRLPAAPYTNIHDPHRPGTTGVANHP